MFNSTKKYLKLDQLDQGGLDQGGLNQEGLDQVR